MISWRRARVASNRLLGAEMEARQAAAAETSRIFNTNNTKPDHLDSLLSTVVRGCLGNMGPPPYGVEGQLGLISTDESAVYEGFVGRGELPPGSYSPFDKRRTSASVKIVHDFDLTYDVRESEAARYLRDTRFTQSAVVFVKNSTCPFRRVDQRRIFKTISVPFFTICASSQTAAAIFLYWEPFPQLLTCLIPDSASSFDNSAGYVASRVDKACLELCFTIYHWEQSKSTSAVCRTTFYYSYNRDPRVEDRWMYFGDPDLLWQTVEEPSQGLVGREHARMHRVIALASRDGWRQAVSLIEQSIANLVSHPGNK